MDSGKCTAAGACVKSPGYSMDGHYGSDQKCKITPLVRLGNLSCKVFETESTNDVLLIGGKAYSGAPTQPLEVVRSHSSHDVPDSTHSDACFQRHSLGASRQACCGQVLVLVGPSEA